jgi:16S rRNA (guanine527-N7)-methyltransferase
VKHDDRLAAAASVLGLDLGSAARAALVGFETLLLERAVPLGLVAASDAPRIRERHVVDCLRAAAQVRPRDRAAYDVGSGAGLPGIVVAITRPTLRVILVEPRRTRVAFLELVVDTLRMPNVEVLAAGIEDASEPVDVCFARAFAPLENAWAAARSRLRPGGRLVYFAGAGDDASGARTLLPGAAALEVVHSPVLESSGPLIIMAR